MRKLIAFIDLLKQKMRNRTGRKLPVLKYMLVILLGAGLLTSLVWWGLDLINQDGGKDPKPKFKPKPSIVVAATTFADGLVRLAQSHLEERLTKLLYAEIPVDSIFNYWVTTQTEILWAAQAADGSWADVATGEKNYAHTQLGLIDGYGKREGSKTMMVRIQGHPLLSKDKQITQLRLKLADKTLKQ